MAIIISPSKTMDFSSNTTEGSIDNLKEKTKILVETIQKFSIKGIEKQMKVKGKLLDSTYNSYQNYHASPWKEAIRAYDGAVFKNIKIDEYNKSQLLFLEENLILLSALYGDISATTPIKEYRLDMTMKVLEDSNLYNFWKSEVTFNLEKRLEKDELLINLASGEFSKIIDRKKFNHTIIDIDFKEYRDGKYKAISTYAKKARGLMCHYIIKNEIKDLERIKKFNLEGYSYNKELSKGNKLIFTR